MIRAGLVALLAAGLIGAAGCGAVLLLFTSAVFDALGFDPVALDYLYGRLSRAELEAMVVLGAKFTAAEIRHLDDVAMALGQVARVFVAAAGVVVVALFLAPAALRAAAGASLAALGVVGAVVVGAYYAFGFEPVGVFFHEIVFPQGNWRFPYDSLIIRLYGADVMVTGAAFVIAVAVGGLVAMFVATRFLRPAKRG